MNRARTVACFLLLTLSVSPLAAQGPGGIAGALRALSPFSSVEADKNKTYTLTDKHGPWLIYAASFTGEGGAKQANELVYELRHDHQLEAYITKHHFDFSGRMTGLGLQEDGSQQVMRHRRNVAFDQYAVMIGNFKDVYDPQVETTLQRIKHMQPVTLDPTKREVTYHSLGLWREVQRRVSPNRKVRSMGPMRAAFVTRNPLIPASFFAPKGLDPLVVKMNRDVQFSLLKCPGKYSVKVATFRGRTTMDTKKIEQLMAAPTDSSQLAVAAHKAHTLTTALRNRGVEAYEFHDRHESIVAVGSFSSVGTKRPDGKIEINPAVHAILKSYGASQVNIPGRGLQAPTPHSFGNIPFDIQPMPIEVPRHSVASDYAQRSSIFE